jgi:hypothetical protein
MRHEIMLGVSCDVAREAMPWACVIVPVDGGWAGWESMDDYETWEAQI